MKTRELIEEIEYSIKLVNDSTLLMEGEKHISAYGEMCKLYKLLNELKGRINPKTMTKKNEMGAIIGIEYLALHLEAD